MSGVTYKGQWWDNEKHGEGTQTWDGGSQYKGQWSGGEGMHGKGTFAWGSEGSESRPWVKPFDVYEGQ